MNSALSEAIVAGTDVNPVAGAAVLAGKRDLDFIIDGPLPLHWQRCYRSGNLRSGWFGRGWGCVLEAQLEACPDAGGNVVDRIVYVDPFGREVEFPQIAAGDTFFSRFERLTLARADDGLYRVTTREGIVHRFGARVGAKFPLVSITDRNSNRIRLDHQYDAGEVSRVQVACSGGQTLELVFSVGRLVEIVDLCPAPVCRMRYAYDAHGDLAAVFDRADACVRRFEYDAERRLRHHVHAERFEAFFEYASHSSESRVARHSNNVGQEWRFASRADHVEVTDQDGHRTLYHVDASRRWIGYTDALGGFTRRGLDRFGNLRAIVDPEERITEAEFDERGNPVAIRDAGGALTTIDWSANFAEPVAVTDPLGRTTRYAYDDRGNLVEKVTPTGAETRYVVDERGLVTAVENAAGGVSKLEYDERGQLVRHIDCSGKSTRFVRDGEGRLAAIIDALGHETRVEYDLCGRVLRHVLADGNSETYEYDAAGRVTAVTRSSAATTRYRYTTDGLIEERIDPLGHRLRYEYDHCRRLAALINENGAAYQFEYDACDRLVSDARVDGVLTCYTYDRAGLLVETVEAPHDAAAIITHYVRDPTGRLLQRCSATSRVDFAYDAAGQLIAARNADAEVSIEYDAGGRIVGELVASGGAERLSRYAYDELGHRIGTMLPDGTKIVHLNYGSGHTHQIACDGEPLTDMGRDDLHREITRTQGVLTTQRRYDVAGRLAGQWARPVGDASADAPDARPGGWPIAREYTYDLAGRLVASLDRGTWRRYDYDAIDRLTRFGDETFAFDPAHNLVDAAAPGHAASGGRVEGNRVIVYQEHRYRYDAHGRIVEKRSGAHAKVQFEWDDEHRLVRSTTFDATGSSSVAYIYDPFGRRIAKSAERGRTDFVWEGQRLAQQSDTMGALTFVYEPDSYVPLAQITKTVAGAAPTVRYYHCDQVGLPRELTDAQGRIVWEADFKAWGRLAAEVASKDESGAPVAQPLRYQGQYFDAETGLHYNRFRYYDPDTARYASPDPIGLFGGENFYQYAVNSVTWIDPVGLARMTPKLKEQVIAENLEFHGTHTCEKCKCALIRPKKSESGVTPPRDEWATDHVQAESVGGPATELNAQLLCRACNREDWDKVKPNYKEQNRAAAKADDEECE